MRRPRFDAFAAAGLIALATGSSGAGAQDFDTRTHTLPNPTNAARAEANAALEAHDYPKAIKLLSPLAAAGPKDPALLYDLGSAQDALDQTGAAEVSYRASIAADATGIEPHVALGLLYARGGKMEQARTELLAATALPSPAGAKQDDPLKARAFRALARTDQRDRPAEAREDLLAALKLSPETPEDALLTAELAARSGNGAAPAEAALRRVLAARPGDPDASAGLARLLVEDKRSPEAEAILRTALEARPEDPVLNTQLATLLSSRGRPAEALPLVEKLRGTPAYTEDANISRLLARLDAQTGDYSKAEPLFAKLSALAPQDVLLLDEQADALIHLKRFAEAQAILSRAVAQPKLFATPAALGEAAGRLAFAASENNDPAASLQALAIRASVLPPSATTLFLEAISEDKLNHVRLAQVAYRKFIQESKGAFPDQEFEAQHRLIALEHRK